MPTTQEQGNMRIVFVSMVPEAGHIIPLLRIASSIRSEQVACHIIVPHEAQKLPAEQGFEYELLPPVLPVNADSLLGQISRTSPLARKLFFNGYFETQYFQPVQYNALSSLPTLEEKLRRLSPDLVIADEHLLGAAIHYVGQRLGIPVLLHLAPGSNQLCQTIQPYAKRQLRLTAQSTAVSALIISKLFNLANKLFNQTAHRKTEEIKSFVSNEWKRIIGEYNPIENPRRVFTTGIAALESQYLRHKIEVYKSVEVFGPLPPLRSGRPSTEIQTWIETKSEKPLILVSLGSWVSITHKISTSLIAGIKQNGCRVLWISRTDPIPDKHKDDPDILWVSWAPQSELLADDRVKCFVSHAGSGAVQEAFWFAKPMLCIPQIRDQPYNAWVVESLGAGRTISKNQFSKARVSKYLEQVLHDTKIRENISRYSQDVRKLDSEEKVRSYLLSSVSKNKSVNQ